MSQVHVLLSKLADTALDKEQLTVVLDQLRVVANCPQHPPRHQHQALTSVHKEQKEEDGEEEEEDDGGATELWRHSELVLTFIQTRAILHQELLEKAIELLHLLIVPRAATLLTASASSCAFSKGHDQTWCLNGPRARQVFRHGVAVCLYKSVSSKRRNRILKMALELLQILCASSSATSSAGGHRDDAASTVDLIAMAPTATSTPHAAPAMATTGSTNGQPNGFAAIGSATEEVPLLLRILDNPEEDANVLLFTTETLRSCVQGNESCAKFAMDQKALPILSRIMENSSNNNLLETRVGVCHVLLALSEFDAILVTMADANANATLIHALAMALSAKHSKECHRPLEFLLLQLLGRLLVGDSRVYAQMIQQGMLEVLFEVVERNVSAMEVTRVACAVLEAITRFARDDRMDLAPFLAPSSCDPLILITAGEPNGNNTPCSRYRTDLVSSVFRFFVNVTDTHHSDDLAVFANPAVMEGLLSLYMASGTSGKLTQLAELLVRYVIRLPRTSIEQVTLENEERTLPSLFLLVRNYSERTAFIAQVYAMLSKYWKFQTASNRSVQLLSGFVSTAVSIVNRVASSEIALKEEMMDVYNFLRLVMSFRDGCELVRDCGGKTLQRSMELLTKIPRRFECGEMARVLAIIEQYLEQDWAPNCAAGAQAMELLTKSEDLRRQGDVEYEAFMTRLMRRESALLRERKQHDLDAHEKEPRTHPELQTELPNQIETNQECTNEPLFVNGITLARLTLDQDKAEAKMQAELLLLTSCRDKPIVEAMQETKPDGKQEDDGEDMHELDDLKIVVVTDGLPPEQQQQEADDHGDQEENDEESDELEALFKPDDLVQDQAEFDQQQSLCQHQQQDDEAMEQMQAHLDEISLSDNTAGPTSGGLLSQTTCSSNVDSIPATFVDLEYYFEDPTTQTKHPKHPLKYPRKDANPQQLLMDAPGFLEPCAVMNADQMEVFIQESSTRRNLFLQRDVARRARIVYENLRVFGYESPTTSGSQAAEGDNPADNASSAAPQPMFSCGSYPYEISSKPNQAGEEFSTPSLTFDSLFESGNLQCAIRVGEREYDLVLRRDVNTQGHHIQWFYFAISNISTTYKIDPVTGDKSTTSGEYRFNIVNLCKPDSLFNQGLQPVTYSVRNAALHRIGWIRAGTNVCYFANPFSRPGRNRTSSLASSEMMDGVSAEAKTPTGGGSDPTYYTLSFTLQFEHLDDTVLIAHSYPYTLTDHRLHLERLFSALTQTDAKPQRIIRKKTLCWTQSGRECEILTITDFGTTVTEINMRRSIILTARVHPGEPQSSWVMRGLLDYLVSDCDEARLLRRLFVFRIVPMLNPDGVFLGNSRCGLSACDLNRQWGDPCTQQHPTIAATKEMIFQEYEKRGIVFFCDFHGHSRKKNVFLYGCDTKKKPNPRARLFAKEFAGHARRFVSYDDCSFRVSKDKEKTARVVLANELKLVWSFTLEASFCGASGGELRNFHFNTSHFQQVGPALCITLLEASVSNSEVRERALALVGNRRFCLPAYVEPSLRELGLTCGGGGAVNGPNGSAISTGLSTTGSFKRDDVTTPTPSKKLAGKKSMKKKKAKPEDKEESIKKTRMVRRTSASAGNNFVGKAVCTTVSLSKPTTSESTPRKGKAKSHKLPRRRAKALEQVVKEALAASSPITAVAAAQSAITTHLPPCGSAEERSSGGRHPGASIRLNNVQMDLQSADSQVVDDAIHLAKMLNSMEAKVLRRAFSPAPSVYYSYEFPSGPMPSILPSSELNELHRSKFRAGKETPNGKLKGASRQLTGWGSPLRSTGSSFRELMKTEPSTRQATYQSDLINAVSIPITQRSTTAQASLSSTRPPKLVSLSSLSSSSRCLPTVHNADPSKS